MDIAAFVVAVGGVLLAALSWIESRKSRRAAQQSAAAAARAADAAAETARLDSERRHDETAPQIRLEWAEVGGPAGNAWRHGVRVINTGTMAYPDVDVELLPPRPGDLPAAVHIQSRATDFVGEAETVIPLGRLDAGMAIGLLVHPTLEEDGLPRGGTASLRFTFTAEDGRTWVQHHDAEVPPPPRVFFG